MIPRGLYSRNVFIGWLACGGVAITTWFASAGMESRALWMVTGGIFFLWGVAVVTNYRGIADGMPTKWGVGPFWQETSTAFIRLIFAFFLVWGAVVFAIGAYDVLT